LELQCKGILYNVHENTFNIYTINLFRTNVDFFLLALGTQCSQIGNQVNDYRFLGTSKFSYTLLSNTYKTHQYKNYLNLHSTCMIIIPRWKGIVLVTQLKTEQGHILVDSEVGKCVRVDRKV
jgi:hypothetical protein